MLDWFQDRLATVQDVVRIRQLIDQAKHRLLFVPSIYIVVAVVLIQLTVAIDRNIDGQALPLLLTTTVDSARALLSTVAGGLISSVTLLMSMTLVTVQLASSQYSPRTLRTWLGNRVLQHTIGMTLGTTVFCLMGLRAARTFEDGVQIVPHTTVIAAVVFGVASLVGVVLSVDNVTHSLQIGSVAARIASDTIGVIERESDLMGKGHPLQTPMPAPRPDEDGRPIPDEAIPILSRNSGWVQQIDTGMIFRSMPDDTTARVVPVLGAFVMEDAPLVWIWPAPAPDEECTEGISQAFALGDSRTMQQDVAFGIAQLTDIAVRALSPGVNDPRTAMDVIVHLTDVLRVLWRTPTLGPTYHEGSKTIVRNKPVHGEFLRSAFEPIRRYGAGDPDVVSALVASLRYLRSEVVRQDLPGPLEPIDAFVAETPALVDREEWSDFEKADFRASLNISDT